MDLDYEIDLILNEPQDFDPRGRDHTDKAPSPFMAPLRFLIGAQPYVLGVDLSHWNSAVDFKALKAGGFEFVILKATEQVNYIDPTFADRWRAALDSGLIVGAYHFFRSNYSGSDQADHHLDTILDLLSATDSRVIPPACDIETSDGATVAARQNRITQFFSYLQPEFGRDTLAYSSPSKWQTLTGNMTLDCTGWTASWNSVAPSWPVGWNTSKRKFWQKGVSPLHPWVPQQVPGVSGECDINLWLDTLAELRAFCGIVELTPEERLDILEREAKLRDWDLEP